MRGQGATGALRALLDACVPPAMAVATVPGVAVGVRAGSEEVAAGYGVTSVEHHAREPEPGRWAPPPPGPIRLGFYARDRVVALAPPGQAGLRGDFGRDAAGRVGWFRWGGRLAPRLGD